MDYEDSLNKNYRVFPNRMSATPCSSPKETVSGRNESKDRLSNLIPSLSARRTKSRSF